MEEMPYPLSSRPERSAVEGSAVALLGAHADSLALKGTGFSPYLLVECRSGFSPQPLLRVDN
jgi:hypothetical protein